MSFLIVFYSGNLVGYCALSLQFFFIQEVFVLSTVTLGDALSTWDLFFYIKISRLNV